MYNFSRKLSTIYTYGLNATTEHFTGRCDATQIWHNVFFFIFSAYMGISKRFLDRIYTHIQNQQIANCSHSPQSRNTYSKTFQPNGGIEFV